MLKTCPTCSYIGNDSEHVCPFCKADLATGRPRRNTAPMFALPILAIVVSAILSACSVSPNGPVTMGASHGSLGSGNMADYYYKKAAGYTYTYSNVEHIYNSDGSVTTLNGANDYVTTMGFDGFAPSGDSMYRIQITYRVLAQYAGRAQMDLWYMKAGKNTPGGYVTDNSHINGAVSESALKRPRPVSTDTILAGVIGRMRTLTDDFTNNGNYVWQTDTLWLTCSNDSVYLWENLMAGKSGIQKTRCIFIKDFINNPASNAKQTNVAWVYDDTASITPWGTNTAWQVANPDFTLTIPAGSYAHSSQISVNTPGIQDQMGTTEFKTFTYGVGMTQVLSTWYVTQDGSNFTKQDFTRSLVSMTQN